MKENNGLHKKLLALVVVILTIALFAFIIIGPAINDYKAVRLEKSIQKIDLPEKTRFIESSHYCGTIKSSGENKIVVSAILYSDLELEHLKEYFSDYETQVYPENRSKLKNYFTFNKRVHKSDSNKHIIIYKMYDPITKVDSRFY